MTHNLKCDHEPFMEIWNGNKRAEFRLNDRNFQLNDVLVLKSNHWHDHLGRFPTIDCKVTHIQTGYGIPEGYVMMSVKVMSKSHG